MVPRPLEQDPASPDCDRAPASSGRRHGGFGRRGLDGGAAPATPAGVGLGTVALRIEDGLLMAFGADGDPLPPAVFAAAARKQPSVLVRFGDTTVAPLRAAAVLEAQTKGALAGAADGAAAERWIRAMLGLGPQPAAATAAELEGERRVCELTAFARELMISLPAGGTFLITEAAGAAAASAGLLLPDGTRISLARMIERIRAEVGSRPAPHPAAAGTARGAAEIALLDCGIQRAGAGIVLDLPSIGAVRLVELAGAAPEGPRVGIFLASGAPVTVAELAATLGHDRPPDGAPEERTLARDPSAGDTMELSLDWPAITEVAADGTADLGMLGRALEACRAQLPSATVVGLPPGAALSAGRRHTDSSWSLAAEDMCGLRLRLPPAAPDDLALEITVRALQGEATRTLMVRRRPRPQAAAAAAPAAAAPPGTRPAPGAATPAVATPGTRPAPGAAAPRLNAATLPAAPGNGASPIRLAVRPPAGAGVNPKDIALVILRGVPPGAMLSAGLDNGDGSWMLSTQDLVGLELSLPAGCAADLTLEVTALAVTSREGALASAAERLRLSLGPAARPIPLALDPAAAAGLQALMIRDLPAGARLSAGTYDPAIDAWVVLPRQLDGLCVVPARAGDGCTLTVMGLARAADGRAETRLVARLPVAPPEATPPPTIAARAVDRRPGRRPLEHYPNARNRCGIHNLRFVVIQTGCWIEEASHG